jgi:tetratricopeptide (TPR) repeat protein
MKQPSENLHSLIKSLSRSEKGYFLKTSSINGSENQYIKLFKAIDSQPIYNESRLKEVLKNEPFIKQLHVAKNYLFNTILKSLYIYNGQNSLNYKFSESISSIAALHDRGLQNESLTHILKAKTRAYGFEKFDTLLELIRWQKYILISSSPSGISDSLQKLAGEELEVINILSNISRYRSLYSRIYSLIRMRGSVRDENEEREFKNIMKDPLLGSFKNALSYEAKLLYYQIHLIYSQAEADDKSTCRYSKELINCIDEVPERKNEFMKEYVFGLVENLSALFNLGRFKEARAVIDRLHQLNVRSQEQKEYIFLSTNIIRFMMDIVECKFDDASKLIPETEKQLKTLSRKEIKITEVILYLNIFYIYFALEKYDKALEWLNKILSSKLEIRQDIYSLAHIFNLLVHYELNNIGLLSYAVVNTYRYLYKRKQLYQFEGVVLKFIKRLGKTEDIKEEFKYVKSQILKLLKDPYERIPLGYFDFISWLDSKILNKSFIEVKKQNL